MVCHKAAVSGMHCTALLLLLLCLLAQRGTAVRANTNLDELQEVVQLPDDLVDLTAYLHSVKHQKMSEDKMRCCCDSWGDNLMHTTKKLFMRNSRSGRCVLLEGVEKCGNVPKPTWATYSLHHYSKAFNRTCAVHKTEVEGIYEKLGSPAGYCFEEKPQVEPRHSKLHETVKVHCESRPGYKSEVDEVKCTYASPAGGALSPAPKCVKVQSYCKGQCRPEPGSPCVEDAQVDEKARVTCRAQGFEPVVEEVTCSAGAWYDGIMQCKETDDWCPPVRPEAPGAPSVPAGKIHRGVSVTCGNKGYQPKDAVLTCSVERKYSSMPACVKVKAYCPALEPDTPGAPRAPPAEIEESVEVSCGVPGFRPAITTVTCVAGPDTSDEAAQEGRFDKSLACLKIEGYCAASSPASPGGPSAPAGRVNEESVVTCAEVGWAPVMAQVTCGAHGKFEDEPACERIPDYCPRMEGAQKLGGPGVHEAAVGQEVGVECLPGFEPKTAMVVCTASEAGGSFQPHPECVKQAEEAQEAEAAQQAEEAQQPEDAQDKLPMDE